MTYDTLINFLPLIGRIKIPFSNLSSAVRRKSNFPWHVFRVQIGVCWCAGRTQRVQWAASPTASGWTRCRGCRRCWPRRRPCAASSVGWRRRRSAGRAASSCQGTRTNYSTRWTAPKTAPSGSSTRPTADQRRPSPHYNFCRAPDAKSKKWK